MSTFYFTKKESTMQMNRIYIYRPETKKKDKKEIKEGDREREKTRTLCT
jgi:hypothetical protein